MKKNCSLKLDRNSIYQDLRTKLDRILTEAKSIETYEIRISKFDFWPMLVYLCRVSFLTTQDRYKAYFKDRHIRRTHAKSDLVSYSLCKKLLRLCALGFCNQVFLDLHY